ncbi:MAG: hypothetical protein OJF62_001196 [Pseudolabrys sp.]|jgi:hypothetical protein|nr:hypothetical protein [Pseudolabrys sp.]
MAWIFATAILVLLQVYFLLHPLANQPASVARLEMLFLGCALSGLIGAIIMLVRREP